MTKLLATLLLAYSTLLTAALTASLASANAVQSTPAANRQSADFVAGKKAIERKDWKAAVESLTRADKEMPDNADVQNYLGYAYRHLGDLDNSFAHYKAALRIDPKHRGAHEYIGQAYLKAGQPEKAGEHLQALEKICGKGCEEYRDLAKAIADYNKGR
ncbi:MAG: tetratricopeptide repeat protein [Burkholderiaceae bacterium]|nr:tetratricopeptide repeat protein [Burkholderiaceae bacterium]